MNEHFLLIRLLPSWYWQSNLYLIPKNTQEKDRQKISSISTIFCLGDGFSNYLIRKIVLIWWIITSTSNFTYNFILYPTFFIFLCFFAGRVSSVHRSFAAAHQEFFLHLVQSSGQKTKISQEAWKADESGRGEDC